MNLSHQKGKSLCFHSLIIRRIRRRASVEKDILFSGMAVNVNKHPELSFTRLLPDHLFQEKYLRVMLLWGCLPLPIEVNPRSRKTIVAPWNPIYIDHGNHFEVEPLPKVLTMGQAGHNFLEKAFDNKEEPVSPGWTLAEMTTKSLLFWFPKVSKGTFLPS